MNKKSSKIFQSLKGFSEVPELRGKKSLHQSPESIKTLSINTSGRITIPHFLLTYLDLECIYFNISFNEKKEAAIFFHNDKKMKGAKKIIRFKNKNDGSDTTAYLGIGPQLRAMNYSWGISKLRFSNKAHRIIIINLKDLST